jgi:hypothetical protein
MPGPVERAAMKTTEAEIKRRQAAIIDAARTLVGMVRVAEQSERGRAQRAELELNVELTAGGNETWVITIERTASSH